MQNIVEIAFNCIDLNDDGHITKGKTFVIFTFCFVLCTLPTLSAYQFTRGTTCSGHFKRANSPVFCTATGKQNPWTKSFCQPAENTDCNHKAEQIFDKMDDDGVLETFWFVWTY